MSNLRWTPERIAAETGKQQRAAQKRWFRNHFGIDVPCDTAGPIMTDETFQALNKKSCGVLMSPDQGTSRPTLRIGK